MSLSMCLVFLIISIERISLKEQYVTKDLEESGKLCYFLLCQYN